MRYKGFQQGFDIQLLKHLTCYTGVLVILYQDTYKLSFNMLELLTIVLLSTEISHLKKDSKCHLTDVTCGCTAPKQL